MTIAVGELLQQALTMRQRAYAPYSGFPVGAVAVGTSGKIYGGCNVENVSSGLTVCAERVALQNAVAQGETQCPLLLVVADTLEPVAPCGACRQVMAEFGVERVVMANTAGAYREVSLDELLPLRFDSQMLRDRTTGK